MPVHVSIHDVSPLAAGEVELALSLCERYAVRPALLVVPNFHGRAPLEEDRAFCARLRDLQRRGHELYLHGWSHHAEPDASTRAWSWLWEQRVVSNREAEMSAVSLEEGARRLTLGEKAFRDAGLRVDGFVPPAWSMPAWLPALLAARGYRFTEDHLRVHDPLRGRSRWTVLLNWATRSPLRLASTVAWCRLAKHARALAPARVAIHPGDLRASPVRREIVALLEWARGDFVARGRDLLGACAE